MKYFIVEGILKNREKMDAQLMLAHKIYTQKAMDKGSILFSGLKTDNNGAVFLMKATSKAAVELYLSLEPFRIQGVQEYTIMEFTSHYAYACASSWFTK